MGELFDTWTRDDAGSPVIWNKPPYFDPGTGALSLMLPGEKPGALDDPDVHHKRISEYYLLIKRDTLTIKKGPT